MARTENDDAKRLIPETPPQRLPEETLLTELKRDRTYRRNASLLRSLLYQPQRLFTSHAPSRLPPARTLRELRYRLVAVVTSLALLIGMVNFAPFNFFSLVGTSMAAAADADYSWLTATDGTTADTAYQIGTPNQLYALSLLVAGLAPSDVATFDLSSSDSPTMEITIGGYTFIVGPDQETVLPPAFSPDSPETPEPTPSAVPSDTPAVGPSDVPTEPTTPPTTEPTTEPTVSPTVEPTTLPSAEPTTEPSTEPTQTSPSESPSSSAEASPSTTPEPSSTPTVEPSAEVSAEARPLNRSLRTAAEPEHTEATMPSPSPSQDTPQPSAPKESDDPAPGGSTEPTPAPSPSTSLEPSPSVSVEPSPSASETPPASPSGDVSASPAPTATTPVETAPAPTESTPMEPTPSPDGGNSLPLPDAGVEASVYSIKVPAGLQGRFIKLTSDISLSMYSGGVGADQGAKIFWTPIGIMKSISSVGAPVGTPFLGTFDGANHTITDFYYAPDPAALDLDFTNPKPTMASYGLFGYVGTGGSVKNLTVRTVDTTASGGAIPIPWNLSALNADTPKNAPLGSVECALAVLAGAVSGTLENCTVSQAYLSYWYNDNWENLLTPVSIGGVAGLVSGGTLKGCTFLGGIKAVTNNDSTIKNSSLQCVGGVTGRVAGSSASTLSKCAAGVDIDIHNGTVLGENGGIGGLYGYNSATVTVSECFTTGVVRAWHDAGGLGGRGGGKVTVSDSYSTVAVGKASSSLGSVAAPPLAYSSMENIGGLFGLLAGGSSSLKNTYFAGSLLESQFGSVSGGMTASSTTFTNVAVDASQAPHSFFKDRSDPASILRDLTGIDALAPADGGAATLWAKSSAASLPQLSWAQTYESDGGTPTTAHNLSNLAAKRWVPLDNTNSISGTDGLFSLYRLKDDATGNTPTDLGSFTLPTGARYYNSDKSVVTGGEYAPKSAADATVDGVSVPILRSAITAVNQTDGQADTISSGIALVRFANRINLAPGGYNGSQYLFTTFDAGKAAIPTYGKNTIRLFCGTLSGGTGAVVSNFTYASGASGIIDTGCDALLQNFTLSNIKIGDVPLGTNSRYCGFAVGQVIRTNLTNVDIDDLSYHYTEAADSASVYHYNSVALGLVGVKPKPTGTINDTRLIFNQCNVENLNISIIANAGRGLGVNFGGLLGLVEGNGGSISFTMQNCSMTGSVNASFAASSSSSSYPNIGGLLGFDNDSQGPAIFTDCAVNANLKGGRVGGLAGRARAFTMTRCTFSGTIATSDNFANPNTSHSTSASGGLVGANEHAYTSGTGITIDNCAVFGNISSRYDAGGFIGYTQKGPTITNSYVSGIVKASEKGGATGGMLGYHDATNSVSTANSYFVGQVISPDTKGAIIGYTKITNADNNNKLTLTSTLYDSTLLADGTNTVGAKPASVTITDTDYAARPGDSKWVTLASNKATWIYSGTDRQYPQLVWLKSAQANLSTLSTHRLFDIPEDLSTIHRIPLGQTFSTVLPGSVTGTPAGIDSASSPPFAQEGEITSGGGYTNTPYVINNADIPEGYLNFTYTGMGPGNTKLELPYVVGIKLFDQGKGTESEPYIIYDLSQLLIFRVFVNSSKNTPNVYYKIGGKLGTEHAGESITIDMTDDAGKSLDWRGTLSALDGQLDGNGSTLTNFHTTGWTVKTGDTTVWNAGLLGGMTSNSSVKNLTILGAESGAIVNSTNWAASSHTAGILSATAGGGTVSGVTTKGSITVDRDINVGGLIGSVNVTQPLSISNCVTDVDIQAATNEDGSDSVGSGGIIGYTTASSAASITLSECATYGTIVDWGNMGGLVGRSSNSNNLQLTIQNSYSLMAFSDSGISVADNNKSPAAVRCGGIVGGVDSLNVLDSSRVIIDSCYYAGENAMSGSGRVVGGFVGGAMATISGQDNYLQNNGRDYLKLNIKNSSYNTDSNKATPAYLYYNGTYNSRYGWPETYWDGAGDIASDNNYGTRYRGKATSFGMSQDANSTELETTMKSWNSTNTWSFSNGLYPLLKNVSVTSDLAFQHLAIHYTKADGVDRYANVFVRYTGAEMSTDCASLLVTENRRMAVAIDNNTANATAPGNTAAVTITATIMGVTGTHTLNIIPSVDSRGYRDASIYYANPNGMWPTKDGEKVWRVYTADALAGLSTIFSKDTVDQNGILQLSPNAMAGGEVWLGRDIDLGQAYYGMGEYNSWRPIGGDAAGTAFNITLDGKGHTLYNLAMNPFIQTQDGIKKTATYKDMTSSQQGLFGTIDGGTVKNLVLAANSSAATSVYRQPGIRVGMSTTAAGVLAATLKSGTLENCLVSIPVYTIGSTPADTTLAGYTEDWSAVPYVGASKYIPMGGLVGQVTGPATIQNCAYTGYVYADPKTVRPGAAADTPVPTDSSAGPVGGLVGHVSSGAALTVTDSYAAGYVHGAQTGALVGNNLGMVSLSGASFDQNAAGGAVLPVGAGTAEGGTVSGSAAPQVPPLIGADWETGTPEGLYPIQSALSAYSGTLAARIRIALTPHASSATGGTLSYTMDGSTLVYNAALQPAVAATPGTVALTGNSFTKLTDGLVQLELTQNGSARRVLINLRCWYDDYTETDGVKHYTISTAEELWELSQIVSGTITNSDLSKVTHTHQSLPDGTPDSLHDDFSGDVIHLASDIDLTTLTDTVSSVTSQRPWLPIGSTNAFAGTFQGGGHSVSGMLLTGVAESGLFGTVSGTVQDLLVTNATLTLPASSSAVGGLLCAKLTASGKLTYCGTSGSAATVSSGSVLGGLVGTSQGTVESCFSTAELTSSAAGFVGGIAGSSDGVSAVVKHSYFTGYVNAANAASTGGIVGNNTGGAVSDCYVSAYLTGKVIYRAAKDAVKCVYDGRHVGTLSDTDMATTRQDGTALTMNGDWTENDGTYYPIPLYYTLPATSSPDIVGSPLARAAKLAAGIFTFSGTSNANYGRFSTVSVSAVTTGSSFLRSGNANLLSVSGNEAHTVSETSGDVVLRLCLGTDGQAAFQRPCWLIIPSALAVTYRFNWEELITKYPDDITPNTSYHTGSSGTNTWSSVGTSHIISTASDWESFVAFANSSSTSGHTFTLDYDINFGGGQISTVTAPFNGIFNGGNHTLSSFSAGAPLFASVEQGAKVEYLGISSGTYTISARGTLNAGVVAGRNAGRIANVAAEYCRLTITQNSAAAVTSAGSLVGQNIGMLDSCYYYVTGDVGNIQMSVTSPAGTATTSLRMGGLVGYNTGTVKGCYNTLSMSLNIGTAQSTSFSSLVGLNDGGSILYSYWRYPYTFESSSSTYTAYKNSDGTSVLAKDLFLRNSYTELAARWLSSDSYGGTYYVSDGRLMLYSFRLAKYDFSGLFGTPMQQYLMLALQFDSSAGGSLFSNGVCSWKGPVLPNFADLPLTSSLSVRLPVLSDKLTFTLSNVFVIRKSTPVLTDMDRATIGGSARSGYSVTGLGTNPTRVFLDIKLDKAATDDQHWGVYRKDSTLPEILS